jgi:hypothetical protein
MNEKETYLASLDQTHNPENVEDNGFSKLPDGEVQSRLDKLYITRAKNGQGRMQCVWEFEVISGKHAFRKIMKFSGMDNAAGLDFLTRDLRMAGIDNFKWSNVESQFNKPLDKLFLLKLQTKIKKNTKTGEEVAFQSIYILKQLDQNEVMKSDTLNDNDVPF